MATCTTRNSRHAGVLQTAYGSSCSIPSEFINLTQWAAPSISGLRSHAPLSLLTPLPRAQSPEGSHFQVLLDDNNDLYGDRCPDTPMPGGGGSDEVMAMIPTIPPTIQAIPPPTQIISLGTTSLRITLITFLLLLNHSCSLLTQLGI